MQSLVIDWWKKITEETQVKVGLLKSFKLLFFVLQTIVHIFY